MVEEWTTRLKDDLVRINKRIKQERLLVNEGIARLKKLEAERKRLLDATLGGDEDE